MTEYALGELQGRAREEFEKELAQSDELQRELEGTVIFCQKLGALPSAREGFDDQETRAKLQDRVPSERCKRSDSGGIASGALRYWALSVRLQLVS